VLLFAAIGLGGLHYGAGSVAAEDTPMKAAQAKQRLVFLGDSITAGYGLDPSEAYPSLIEEKLAEKKLSIEVVNAGITGDTTAGGAARLDWVLREPVAFLFVALGANDGLRGVSPEVTKGNLLQIIKKAKEKYPAIKVVVAGNMIPPSMGKSYFEQFRKVFPEVANETGVTLMPFLLESVAGESKLNLEDGIHPTAEGQRIIAANVWKTLEPILLSPAN